MSINPRSTYSVCKTSRVQRGIYQNSDWRDPRFIILLIDSRPALATWMVLYITKSPFEDFEFDAIFRNLPSRVNVAVDAPLNAWSAPLEKKKDSQCSSVIVFAFHSISGRREALTNTSVTMHGLSLEKISPVCAGEGTAAKELQPNSNIRCARMAWRCILGRGKVVQIYGFLLLFIFSAIVFGR